MLQRPILPGGAEVDDLEEPRTGLICDRISSDVFN